MLKKNIKRGMLGLVSSATLVLSGCLPGLSAGGIGEEGITITTQTGTEMTIIGYMVQDMLNYYLDIETDLITNLATNDLQQNAINNGQADMRAVGYTGTVLTANLGLDPINDPDEAEQIVIEGFDEQFDMKWYENLGFENTYWFLVTQEVADEYGLETVSDLEEYADELNFGVDDSWLEREGDGYQGFIEEYGFEFDNDHIYAMQIGLIYDAVATGHVDVALGYSTDGRISSYDLVHLEDDRQFFPPYDAAPAVNNEILEIYPEVDDVLSKLIGQIDTETMQQLNYVADDYLVEPAVVARTFLEENNFFEDVEPYVDPQGSLQ